MKHKCIVKLWFGSYTGLETVYCEPDEDSDTVIARAWKQAKADFLTIAFSSAKIISREPEDL